MFTLVLLVVHKVSVVPSIQPKYKIFSDEVNDWLESKHTHNDDDLVPNIFIPSSAKISVFTFENWLKILTIVVFNKVHSNHHWQHYHVNAKTDENGKCSPTCFLRYFVEPNIWNNGFCHCIEETVVDDDNKRCDYIVTLTKFLILNVILADLVSLYLCIWVGFISQDLLLDIRRQLVDSIHAILFVGCQETMLTILVITEARECTIDILGHSLSFISWLIKVFPCMIRFFLVLNLCVVWNLLKHRRIFFLVNSGFFNSSLVGRFHFRQSFLVNIWILNIVFIVVV